MTEKTKDPFADTKLRSDVIDAVIRLLIVSREGEYNKNSISTYDQYAVRAAVAMAVSLYADKDVGMISAMKNLQSKDHYEDSTN